MNATGRLPDVMFGGRITGAPVFDDVSTGAENDLQRELLQVTTHMACPAGGGPRRRLAGCVFHRAQQGLLAALWIGLVIGLERGWRNRELADGERVAGLRTFALTGSLGGVLAQAGAWLLAVGALGLAALATVSYREAFRLSGSLSVTSAVAMLLDIRLGRPGDTGRPRAGGGHGRDRCRAAELRPELHQWLRLMEHRETSAALQSLLSAVILPFLPDASYGPYSALNPYRLWWAVVLIAGLSLSGHVAMRFAGAQRGAQLTGLALASSTAATVHCRGMSELIPRCVIRRWPAHLVRAASCSCAWLSSFTRCPLVSGVYGGCR